MISSRATAASACRAVLPPPGAGVFPLRNRAVGRHRKVKLGDWRQPWLRVAGALLLVVSAGIHLDLYGIALASTGGGGEPASAEGSGVTLKTATIGGVTVLTSADGFTLYWFVPDSPTASRCTGSCAAYWPPVIGTPTAGPGVTTG